MDKFIEQHGGKVRGALSCFDRVLFRGYLPIMSGAAMAQYLKSRDVRRETLKPFLLEQAERLKQHALTACTRADRPYQYLAGAARKEDIARKIVERDGIASGWCACCRSSSHAGRSRWCGTSGRRTCSRLGASACTFTTTSWIGTSVSSMFQGELVTDQREVGHPGQADSRPAGQASNEAQLDQ